jgi:hypothetical protein
MQKVQGEIHNFVGMMVIPGYGIRENEKGRVTKMATRETLTVHQLTQIFLVDPARIRNALNEAGVEVAEFDRGIPKYDGMVVELIRDRMIAEVPSLSAPRRRIKSQSKQLAEFSATLKRL